MNILTTQKPLSRSNFPKKPSPSMEKPPSSGDSFSFSMDADDVKETLAVGALGVVPLVGAATHFVGFIGAGLDDDRVSGWSTLIGGLANVGGTATAITGLCTGSGTALKVGLGLLGLSGLGAAVAEARL